MDPRSGVRRVGVRRVGARRLRPFLANPFLAIVFWARPILAKSNPLLAKISVLVVSQGWAPKGEGPGQNTKH